jgi:hypothetical protein
MAAPELPFWEGRVWCHETRDSAGAHLGREARSGAEEYVVAPEFNSVRRRNLGPRGSTRAHLSQEVRIGAV